MQNGILTVAHRKEFFILPGLFVAFMILFEFPASALSFSRAGAGYVPLVSFLLSGIREEALPSGFRIANTYANENLEIYLFSSGIMALMLISPLISYSIFGRLIVPGDTGHRKTKTFLLTMIASAIFAVGAIFTYFSSPVYAVQLILYGNDMWRNPVIIDSFYFYSSTLGVMAIVGAVCEAPVLIVSRIVLHRHRKE